MTELRTILGPSLLLAGVLLAPSLASAQMQHDRHMRIAAHLALGLAGEYDASASSGLGSGSTGDSNLEPSVGFGLRAEMPVLDFLSVGGMFEAITYEPDVRGSEREWAFNFDLLLRLRYMFEVIRGDLFLEPYLALPVGFTLGVLPLIGDDSDSAWPGWNIGALAGLAILTASRLGGFIELGWRHFDIYNSDRVPVVGDVDYQITVNELALNLGVMFMLD